MIEDTRPAWRKSSHSGGNNGDCIEVANTLGELRDSKNPAGPTLLGDCAALLAEVKAGRFDV